MRIYLETFGCQMNELDSQLVRGHLRSLGHEFVAEDTEAEVILYNTCSVREHAEQKAWSRIGVIGVRKREGERILLGVLGCMAERDGLDIFRKHPQVDLLCGPGELDKLPQLIDNAARAEHAGRESRVALAGNKSRRTATLSAAEDDLESLDLGRAFDPDSAEARTRSAYVRITRGCNKFCTYCVVPRTRGAEVHRPPENIIDECRRLADAGVIEVTLLGQTVNHYRYTHGAAVSAEGRALPQVGPGLSAFRAAVAERTTTFADLLFRIHEEVPALRRIRFLTSYPRDFGQDVLRVMRDCPRISRYLHAPAQSGSDRILRLMNRGYTVGEYLDFAESAIDALPDLCLAGDFIVGFPTETEEDFEATCALVSRLPFKNNFIFKYSPRPGTVAHDRLADDVPDEVKRSRNNRLLALQATVSARVHAAWVGKVEAVLFDSARIEGIPARPVPAGSVELRWESAPEQQAQAVGRTSGDLIVAVPMPELSQARAMVGRIRPVRIQAAGSLLLSGSILSSDMD